MLPQTCINWVKLKKNEDFDLLYHVILTYSFRDLPVSIFIWHDCDYSLGLSLSESTQALKIIVVKTEPILINQSLLHEISSNTYIMISSLPLCLKNKASYFVSWLRF